MNLLEGSYKSSNGKDYFYAVGFESSKTIKIYKNFGCIRAVEIASGSSKIWFLGDNVDINRIPKKYNKWQIL